MIDAYVNFQDLAAHEKEGSDYLIEYEDRGTDIAILGIHGGEIEPDTEVVARSLAGEDLSYYLFLGNAERLHLTSIHFDEPLCLALVGKSRSAISIHGKSGDGEFMMLGGLDDTLIRTASLHLLAAGFELKSTEQGVLGTELQNICNKGASGKGLQIEMSRELRTSLAGNEARMVSFCGAIRAAVL